MRPKPADSRVAYLDASAIVKLVVAEPETDALRGYLETADVSLTSRIGAIEVARAVVRADADVVRAIAVLDALLLIELTADIADRASGLAPADLRTLDAIHLATAIEFRRQSHAFLTYDRRLADAARRHGLTVVAPG